MQLWMIPTQGFDRSRSAQIFITFRFIVNEVDGCLMGRDQHDDRKRALALGKFKFLYQVIFAELKVREVVKKKTDILRSS